MKKTFHVSTTKDQGKNLGYDTAVLRISILKTFKIVQAATKDHKMFAKRIRFLLKVTKATTICLTLCQEIIMSGKSNVQLSDSVTIRLVKQVLTRRPKRFEYSNNERNKLTCRKYKL